jgi:hypothetical protein
MYEPPTYRGLPFWAVGQPSFLERIPQLSCRYTGADRYFHGTTLMTLVPAL